MSHCKNQFCESYWQKVHKRVSILRVIFLKRVQFLESCWKEGFNSLSHIGKKKVPFFDSYFQKGFKSLSHIQFLESIFFWQKEQIFESGFFKKKKRSILWVIFFTKFNSWSEIEKRVQFFEAYRKKKFSAGVLFAKRVQFFKSNLKKRVQFFESFLKKFNYWVTIKKKVQFFGSHCIVKSSILWDTL